jgi:hypothetical protein
MITRFVENGDESLENQMRQMRNALLADSDWAMSSDAPTDKTAWATYRQQLRDFPSTWTPSDTADFPDPPT